MPNLRARELRNNMTPQEVKLWCQLKHFNARGFHFRQQAPIGNCIVDFVEKSARLVIEVDGSQHGFDPGIRSDATRDRMLTQRGFRVLRFWNHEVDRSMDGVIDAIAAELAARIPPAAFRAAPSPRAAKRDEEKEIST
jgi:very-short-patch-repair endonuclease